MRTFRFLGVSLMMATLMVLGLTACSDDEYTDYKSEGVKVFSSFTATIDDSADTRVILGDSGHEGKKRVSWNVEDEIVVFSDTDPTIKTFKVTSITDDNKASFQGDKVSGNMFYAYYPKSDSNLDIDKYNPEILHVSLPANDFNEGESILMPMVAVSNGNTLAFKQVTGLIHISIGGIYKLESVSLYGNNNEILFGKGFIDLSADKPEFKLDENQTDNISLGGSIQSAEEQLLCEIMAEIYFPLPPMTLENGFTLEIRGSDVSGKPVIFKKSTEASVIINRAEIYHYTLTNVMDELNAQGSGEIIEFEDLNVKAICVQYFDKDGDRELSYAEAESVIEIPTVKGKNGFDYPVFAKKDLDFRYEIEGASSLYKFNELQFFKKLKEIPKNMFAGQDYLSEVKLPQTLTTIGDDAFSGCSSLTNIIIPASVISIGNWAFYRCDLLNSIVLPEKVTSVGKGTFSGCDGMLSIIIPDGITTIEEYAFRNCRSLTNIVLPRDLKSVGNSAFMDCRSLASIEIPEGVTSIGEGAFLRCSSLANIVIPKEVKSLGYFVFAGCTNLTSISSMAINPPFLDEDLGCNCTIFVPDSSVDAYKAADGWSAYAGFIQAIPE